MKNVFLVCLAGLIFISPLVGQTTSSPFWRTGSESEITDRSNRQIIPDSYQVWNLDESGVAQHLNLAPLERNAAGETLTFSIPAPDGSLQRFALVNVPVMEPGLSAKYPGIETYAGIGIDNPHVRARLDMTPHGFHAWVKGDGTNYYVDPYSRQASGAYIVYHAADDPGDPHAVAACGVEDEGHRTHDHDESRVAFSYGEDLLTYRFAVTTAAPYTQFHGGTKADALAAVTTVVNRVNMIYESEFSIRLVLIAETDTLFFTDLATNPFTQDPTQLGTALAINQTIIDDRIGTANYDVGHVFSRAVLQPGQGSYVAGIASLAAVCNSNRKARGASAQPSPIGNPYAGIVMHELGHQFNVSHGYNSDEGSCGGQRSGGWAFQPGGGTTIMCYPGVCGTHNVQNSRDYYFHTGSHEQVYGYTRLGFGANCAQLSSTGNMAPVVDGGNQPLYLPVNTPFELTGNATDPDGDNLTYAWEQIDLGPAGHPSFPSGTAPIFRSFIPFDSTTRTFPQWSALFANQPIIGEILPTYARPLNFRFTARDNKGGVANAEVKIDVTESAGPFQVLSPNSTADHVWEGGSFQEVSWDVANTDGGLINVSHVNILLDTDNTPDFPITLAANVPNDGSEIVVVPDLATVSGRVRVEAVDHIFFDISDEPITISLPADGGYSMFFPEDTILLCLGDSATFPVYTLSQNGYQAALSFFAIGIPFGMQVGSAPGSVGDTMQVTFRSDSNLVAGSYTFQLFGESGNIFEDLNITVVVSDGEPELLPVLPAPNDLSGSGTELQPVLGWTELQPNLTYSIEIATDVGFTNIFETANDVSGNTYAMNTVLSPFTTYYWRIRAMNVCGEGPNRVGGFQTGLCSDIPANDLPITMSPIGAPSIVSSTINVGISGAVTDINVVNLTGTHNSVNDLEFVLISPTGTEVLLADALCGDNDQNFSLSFNDDAASNSPECPLNNEILLPAQALTSFVGEEAQGIWTLEIRDNVNFNGGQFDSWGLQICVSGVQSNPEIIRNDTLFTTQWYAADITQALLEAVDNVSTPDQLSFTLLSLPTHGGILLNGSNLVLGGSFTQKDINDGALSYLQNGDDVSTDHFVFSVSNFAGGWTGTPAFTIQIDNNTSIGRPDASWKLEVFPNPAQEQLQVRMEDLGVPTTVRLFDAQGRLVRTARASESLSWSVQGLAEGLYLLEAENTQGRQTRKVLIRR